MDRHSLRFRDNCSCAWPFRRNLGSDISFSICEHRDTDTAQMVHLWNRRRRWVGCGRSFHPGEPALTIRTVDIGRRSRRVLVSTRFDRHRNTVVAILLGVTFFALIVTAGSLLQTNDPLAVAAATLVVAALFNPLRQRVQRRVDRRFNRSGYQAETLSEGLAVKLREPLSSQDITALWSQTIEEVMQPHAIGIWLGEAGNRSRAARDRQDRALR